ncbi:hypothetical protein Baya_12884 [Bagarius yarrelli]|uniref:Uncharacterized protein n=1 Tax=Bagarius yarrelli TaxID=175774 RepID=A0A556V4D8_BAGYA|nr:hypothetical protein Baya_12884 [Bagarius yarrelli]
MAKFVSKVETARADNPLRPLLIGTGAAAIAGEIFFYGKRSDGEQTTSDSDVTTAPGDPVCIEWTPVQPAEVLQEQTTNAEAEAKIQASAVSDTKLEDRIKELEELLYEALRDCDMKNEVETNDMKKPLKHKEEELLKFSLAKAEEQHQKAVKIIAQLESKFDEMMKIYEQEVVKVFILYNLL